MNFFFKNITIIAVALIFSLAGCRQIDLYEKNTTIPSYKWPLNFAATSNFQITDTLSSYNIFIVLRHTDAYNYNNIWLSIGLQAPGDSMYLQNVDLSLGNDASGWEGSGMNDIWEVRKLLSGQPRRFKKPGDYIYSIKHIMRDNPLNGVMSVGLRLEKVK
ncbi:MAG: gliding motility lipoprotein GldH [Ferruginibacter sp.]